MLTPLKAQPTMPGRGMTFIVFYFPYEYLQEHFGTSACRLRIDGKDARGWHLLHDLREECLIYEFDGEPDHICIWTSSPAIAQRAFEDFALPESAVVWRRS